MCTYARMLLLALSDFAYFSDHFSYLIAALKWKFLKLLNGFSS